MLALILPTAAEAVTLHRDSLPNGLVVLTYPDHRLPMADIALVCRSGATFDPPGRAGTATLTAYLLARGTPDMSGDSVSTVIEYIGGKFEGEADHDRCVLRLRVLTRDIPLGLRLLADGTRRPSFDSREFTIARDQFLTNARRRYDYPQAVVSTELERLLFAGHPYAFPARGDTGTLPSIRREDIVEFHRTHFVPNNCFLVAVGDIEHAAFMETIRVYFGDWQPSPVPPLDVPEVAWPETTTIKIITRFDMNQTYVQFGHPGISVNDTDLLATRLMSYILGGSPLSSRLGLSVREEGGLAYDVRCWFDRRQLSGGFHATVQTSNPRLALEKMFEEVRRMHQGSISTAELTKAINYFTGSFPLTYSSNQGKLRQLINQELFRFGEDWLDRFPDDVRAITLEQVNRAARQRLRPDRYYVVIMGPLRPEDIQFPGCKLIQ
ncbi:MAG: pitrilysin family protein [candidate division WOR-3 bacterium]